MVILAIDTATDAATAALVLDGEVLGERRSRAVTILEDCDALLRQGGVHDRDLGALAVGIGPGQLHRPAHWARDRSRDRLRARPARRRPLDSRRRWPQRAARALPVIDARPPGGLHAGGGRRSSRLPPGELAPEGRLCVGDGAVRYRETLEALGAVVPPDDDPRHVPWARHHALLARDFGPAEDVEPLYLRVPDAERTVPHEGAVARRLPPPRPADLQAIETIERASYPTPWSRSMFAGELAKPSSICLGGFDPESGELMGYMVISRYVDAWHVMNIAVATDHRRKGVATAAAGPAVRADGRRGRRGYTRGARLQRRDRALRAVRLQGARVRAATTRITVKTR